MSDVPTQPDLPEEEPPVEPGRAPYPVDDPPQPEPSPDYEPGKTPEELPSLSFVGPGGATDGPRQMARFSAIEG